MIDRFGCYNVMMISSILAALTPLFYLFSTPGNIWPVLLHNTMGALFWSGSNLAANNLQLIYSPSETRPTHIALYSCITAIAGGTLGSLAGGALLETMNSHQMFTGSFDRYQALITLSVVLRLAFMIILVPQLTRDNEKRPKDLIQYIWHTLSRPLRHR